MSDKERLVELIHRGLNEWSHSANMVLEKCLADYILKDGWIRPPCKVGTKVYYFSENPLNFSVQVNTIYEAKVVRIVTTNLGTSLVIQIHNEYGCTEIPDITYFGKTVFLTREEAEKALEGNKIANQ